MEVDYEYDVDDELIDKLESLLYKYQLDLLVLINKEILGEDKKYEDVYDDVLSKKRREVYDRLKGYLIEKKKKELGGKGEELLTEENLRRWIEDDGETYVSIAIKYTGCLYTIVSQKAKEYGIESVRENNMKLSDYKDDDVQELVKEYDLDEIYDGLHKFVTMKKNVNDMTFREKVMMEICDSRDELLEKSEIERMIDQGMAARDIIEKIGCSFAILKVYMKSYELDMEKLNENGISKGKQMKNKMIRKKYARY
jgi:hypothetical protein